jgi:acylphosphatase
MNTGDENGTIESWQVRVCGRVQGVGYREACVRRARTEGITGWVRNRTDGSVEVLLQGSPAQLADMCKWLSEGISAALVAKLEVAQVQPPFPHFSQFEHLPTV